MTFFDDLGVGIEQYRRDFPYGTATSVVLIPVIKEVPKGLAKKRKPWTFEYDFYFVRGVRCDVYVGSQVLEAGAYTWYQCLKFSLEKTLKYPVELSLQAMMDNVTYEVDGEHITLKEALENLEVGESFSWIIYGSFVHPLGDTLTELEILIPDAMKDLLTCKIKMPHPLKSGSKLKLLFTLTKSEAMPKLPYVQFGCKGRGRRSGES